ncbi:MAG: hypothetical protein AAF789_08560 [Bacteroidota bacterium]
MKAFLLTLFLGVFAFGALAQFEMRATPLKEGDVEKFVSSFPSIQKELAKLDKKYKDVSDMSILQGMQANAEVSGIFQRYGWGDDWLGKTVSILFSYSVVKVEEEIEKLPDAQKAQMAPYMRNSTRSMRDMVTEKDIELVRNNMAELDKVVSQ